MYTASDHPMTVKTKIAGSCLRCGPYAWTYGLPQSPRHPIPGPTLRHAASSEPRYAYRCMAPFIRRPRFTHRLRARRMWPPYKRFQMYQAVTEGSPIIATRQEVAELPYSVLHECGKAARCHYRVLKLHELCRPDTLSELPVDLAAVQCGDICDRTGPGAQHLLLRQYSSTLVSYLIPSYTQFPTPSSLLLMHIAQNAIKHAGNPESTSSHHHKPHSRPHYSSDKTQYKPDHSANSPHPSSAPAENRSPDYHRTYASTASPGPWPP